MPDRIERLCQVGITRCANPNPVPKVAPFGPNCGGSMQAVLDTCGES